MRRSLCGRWKWIWLRCVSPHVTRAAGTALRVQACVGVTLLRACGWLVGYQSKAQTKAAQHDHHAAQEALDQARGEVEELQRSVSSLEGQCASLRRQLSRVHTHAAAPRGDGEPAPGLPNEERARLQHENKVGCAGPRGLATNCTMPHDGIITDAE